MDRAFIEQNQIVERYLTGKLPFKGAQDFERYCRDHPEVLEDLKLAERLHAGMRLLEASGRPPGWQEPNPAWWRRWETAAALAVACLVLGVTVWVLSAKYSNRKEEIAELQQRLEEGPLQPPTATRTINATPDRAGSSGRPTVALRLPDPPELIELRIDVSFARQNAFRLIIERQDRTRVGTIHNLLRDSNGVLRLVINSSALRPGDYRVAIEGLPFRGSPIAVGWMTLRVFR